MTRQHLPQEVRAGDYMVYRHGKPAYMRRPGRERIEWKVLGDFVLVIAALTLTIVELVLAAAR